MKFSGLNEQQQLTIQPVWRKWNPALPMEDIEEEGETVLWSYFLEAESDPEEILALYYALFDPSYQAKLDVFDACWKLLLQYPPPGFNPALAQIYAMTGRLEELKELLDGLSKTE